jgi:hypothetical protein
VTWWLLLHPPTRQLEVGTAVGGGDDQLIDQHHVAEGCQWS